MGNTGLGLALELGRLDVSLAFGAVCTVSCGLFAGVGEQVTVQVVPAFLLASGAISLLPAWSSDASSSKPSPWQEGAAAVAGIALGTILSMAALNQCPLKLRDWALPAPSARSYGLMYGLVYGVARFITHAASFPVPSTSHTDPSSSHESEASAAEGSKALAGALSTPSASHTDPSSSHESEKSAAEAFKALAGDLHRIITCEHNIHTRLLETTQKYCVSEARLALWLKAMLSSCDQVKAMSAHDLKTWMCIFTYSSEAEALWPPIESSIQGAFVRAFLMKDPETQRQDGMPPYTIYLPPCVQKQPGDIGWAAEALQALEQKPSALLSIEDRRYQNAWQRQRWGGLSRLCNPKAEEASEAAKIGAAALRLKDHLSRQG